MGQYDGACIIDGSFWVEENSCFYIWEVEVYSNVSNVYVDVYSNYSTGIIYKCYLDTNSALLNITISNEKITLVFQKNIRVFLNSKEL